MSREIDRRDFSPVGAGPEVAAGLTEAARSTSDSLAGPHRIKIKGVDRVTGNPSGLVSEGAPVDDGNYVARALQHLQSVGSALGLSAGQPNEFAADPQPQTTSSGAVVVHLHQYYKSIPIFQADQSLNFTPDGAIDQTSGTTFSVPDDVSAKPGISVETAALKAGQFLATPGPDEEGQKDAYGVSLDPVSVDITGWRPRKIAAFSRKADLPSVLEAGPFGDVIKASLIWLWMSNGLRLGWHLVFTMPSFHGQYRVIVDAGSGDILYSHQLVQSVVATGNVYERDGSLRRVSTAFPLPVTAYGVTPVDLPAGFPKDWVGSNSTVGNIVNAHLEDAGPPLAASISGNGLSFDPADPAGDEQRVLNLFYYTCFMHDYLYMLGFREADGNFQQDDPGTGGIGSDALDARAYRGAVWATASMSTPADGTSPLMKMGLVAATNRHTALDSTVVFHEYTHGMTNRLVGGLLNDQALDAPQSAGMGEGWSDYVACTITGQNLIAAWVLDSPGGARAFPYDGNFPDSFAKLGTGRYNEAHNIGEIWAATLLEMNRAIGTELGIQLVVDSLKLTPANPSFPDARDAIFLALDHMLAANKLTAAQHLSRSAAMWKVFARFGLGPAALSNGASLSGIAADFTVPGAAAVTPPMASAGLFTTIGNPASGLPACSAVAVLSRAGRLDAFAAGRQGGIYAANCESGAWSAWSPTSLANAPAAPMADISAIATDPDRIDLFVVGGSGAIMTSARASDSGTWSDWSAIGTASDRAPSGSVVSAVSSGADRIDLFIVASDGGVYTAGRAGDNAGWSEWTRIGSDGDRVPIPSAVSTLATGAGGIELFVVAADGHVYTTSGVAAGSNWADWAKAGPLSGDILMRPHSTLTLLSPQAGQVQIFAAAADGRAYTGVRAASGEWGGWTRIGGAADTVPLPCTVGASLSASGQLSVFITGGDGGVYRANSAGGAAPWTGWSRVGGASDRAPLHAVIRPVYAKDQDLVLLVVGVGGVVASAVLE